MNWPIKIVLLALVVLLLLMLKASTEDYREGMRYSHNLPMTFAHQDHAEQQCVECHHNYIDDTGQGLCMICHQTDPRVSHLMRDQFHDLCMGCHQENREKGEKAGPLRRCVACHVGDAKA